MGRSSSTVEELIVRKATPAAKLTSLLESVPDLEPKLIALDNSCKNLITQQEAHLKQKKSSSTPVKAKAKKA